MPSAAVGSGGVGKPDNGKDGTKKDGSDPLGALADSLKSTMDKMITCVTVVCADFGVRIGYCLCIFYLCVRVLRVRVLDEACFYAWCVHGDRFFMCACLSVICWPGVRESEAEKSAPVSTLPK